MSDIKEHCGLFGVYGCEDAAERVYYGLYSLQHRGGGSAGIASTDGKENVFFIKNMLMKEIVFIIG